MSAPDPNRLREAIGRITPNGQNVHGSGHSGWTSVLIDDFRLILGAAKAHAATASGWQPIETAPEYLRKLEHLLERTGGGAVTTWGPTLVWSRKTKEVEAGPYWAKWLDWGDGKDAKSSHWREARAYDGDQLDPTHWMRLSDPTPASPVFVAAESTTPPPLKPVWHLTGSGSKSGPPFERLCTALEEKHVAGFVDLLLKDGYAEILVERKG